MKRTLASPTCLALLLSGLLLLCHAQVRNHGVALPHFRPILPPMTAIDPRFRRDMQGWHTGDPPTSIPTSLPDEPGLDGDQGHRRTECGYVAENPCWSPSHTSSTWEQSSRCANHCSRRQSMPRMPKPLFVSGDWHAPPAAALLDVAGRSDHATSRQPASNTTPPQQSLHAVRVLFAGTICVPLGGEHVGSSLIADHLAVAAHVRYATT